MESLKLWFVLLAGFISFASANHQCREPPFSGDGSWYPKRPLRWRELNDNVMGGNPASVPYYEVYTLQPSGMEPALRKVILQWLRENGTYHNDVSGWYPLYDMCINSSISFQEVPGPSVKFEFDMVLTPIVRHVGTMYSSCPNRYLISWYCPVDELIMRGRYCRSGAKISLLTPNERPDHLPWQNIVKDLCVNDSPPMDDPRWWFVFENYQCSLHTPTTRTKRDVSDVPQKSVWP